MEFKCSKWFTERRMGSENELQNLSRFIYFINIFYFYSLNITFINIEGKHCMSQGLIFHVCLKHLNFDIQTINLKYHNKWALCAVCSKVQHHFDNFIYVCAPVYIFIFLTSSILLFISHPSFPPSYLIFSYFLCHLIQGRKQQWVLGEAADQFP